MPTKQEWDRINYSRNNYMSALSNENREITTLTEEQHDALEHLCSDRHYIHTNSESLYLSESAEAGEIDKMVGYSGDSMINNYLSEAELPNVNFNSIEYPLDDDSYESMEFSGVDMDSEDSKEEYRVKGLESAHQYTEKINNLIEDYLRSIDTEHGTHYASTGGQRLLN
jgi:hypothetical protein